MGRVLPAMGYNRQQIQELENVINRSGAEVVISGTPIDITRIMNIVPPVVRVTYDIQEKGEPNLESVLTEFLNR